MRGLAAAVVLSVTLMLPAAATASSTARRHHLDMYKVEKHIDLEGDFPNSAFHVHLFCKAGDWAVDGMWRIDHVDQQNPDVGVFGDERDVQIDASYGDDVDHTKWHFRGNNNADGEAQVKLWITCLGDKTQSAGNPPHVHNVVISARHDSPNVLVASPIDFDHSLPCAAGEIAVAPGFNFTAGSGRIYRNWPTPNFRGWHWGFVTNASANVTTYLRCLRIKTASAGSGPHAHNILYNWTPGYGGDQRFLATGNTEQRLDCGQHEKGLVGGYWIDDPFHVWYLGMDPRIKQRAYRFYNDGGGSNSIYLSLLCVNDRVGNQVGP